LHELTRIVLTQRRQGAKSRSEEGLPETGWQNKVVSVKRVKSKILIAAFSFVCIFVAVVIPFGCSQRASEIRTDIVNPPVLEFENVLQYKLDLNPNTKIPQNISGVCGRSAYDVSEVTTKTNGDTLVVLVKIDLFKGQTGGFSYALKIGKDIKYLKFGTKEHLLWQRQ
jgi:flagellar motor switch/type III secretory pathway protein FliN